MKKKKKNNHQNLPLLTLFTQLREAGLFISIDEYQLALEALHEGFGVANYEDLKSVCQALWVKSEDDLYRFNYNFDKVMEAEFAALRRQKFARLAKRRRTVKIIRIVSLVSLFLVGVGMAVWFSHQRADIISDIIIVPPLPDTWTGNISTSVIWILLSTIVLIVAAIVILLVTQRIMGTRSEQESNSSQTTPSKSPSEETKIEEDESPAFLAVSQPNSRVDEVFGDRPRLTAE